MSSIKKWRGTTVRFVKLSLSPLICNRLKCKKSVVVLLFLVNFMNFMFINSHSVQGDPVQGFIVVSCILSGNTQCADAEAWCSGQQLKTWTDNQLVFPPRIVAEYWSSVPEDLVESSVMMSTFNIYLDLCCLFLSSERRLYVLPKPWFWWNIFWSTDYTVTLARWNTALNEHVPSRILPVWSIHPYI